MLRCFENFVDFFAEHFDGTKFVKWKPVELSELKASDSSINYDYPPIVVLLEKGFQRSKVTKNSINSVSSGLLITGEA